MAEHPDPKLERLKIYADVAKVLVSVLFGTVAVAVMNWSIQQRQLEEQKLKNQAEIEKTEMQYLGDYLQYALQDDADKRLRFAEYFAGLTLSKDLQEKWERYRARLEAAINEKKEITAKLLVAEKQGNDEEAVRLSVQLATQQSQLADLKAPSLRVHIQTRSGKVTDEAKRVRQTLMSARYLADYEKVFDMTKETTNVVSTNVENDEVADGILQILQPLGIGEFAKKTDPRLDRNEAHIFLTATQ